jgi:hypothetical protein
MENCSIGKQKTPLLLAQNPIFFKFKAVRRLFWKKHSRAIAKAKKERYKRFE